METATDTTMAVKAAPSGTKQSGGSTEAAITKQRGGLSAAKQSRPAANKKPASSRPKKYTRKLSPADQLLLEQHMDATSFGRVAAMYANVSSDDNHKHAKLVNENDTRPVPTKRCPECNENVRARNFARHRGKHSQTRTSFRCAICLTKITRVEDMPRHIRIHYAGRQHMCEKCGYAAARKDTLSAHLSKCKGLC